jgi:hypothetical protein
MPSMPLETFVVGSIAGSSTGTGADVSDVVWLPFTMALGCARSAVESAVGKGSSNSMSWALEYVSS